MCPQSVGFAPGAARSVIGLFGCPLRAIHTFSLYRPERRQPVCPARRRATSLDTLASGDRRSPRFRSLPLGATKRWQPGAFAPGLVASARGARALDANSAVTDARTTHHASFGDRETMRRCRSQRKLQASGAFRAVFRTGERSP